MFRKEYGKVRRQKHKLHSRTDSALKRRVKQLKIALSSDDEFYNDDEIRSKRKKLQRSSNSKSVEKSSDSSSAVPISSGSDSESSFSSVERKTLPKNKRSRVKQVSSSLFSLFYTFVEMI